MCLFWEFCREEKMVKKIELGICVNVQHLTIDHSLSHWLQPIKHFAQILSGGEGGKKSVGGIRENAWEGAEES